MTFMIVLTVVSVVLTIIAFVADWDDILRVCLIAVSLILVLLFVFSLAIMFDLRSTTEDMRSNPSSYTLFDALKINERIKSHKSLQETFLSFYNNVDLSYLSTDPTIYRGIY